MINRKIGIIAFLLCFCFHVMIFGAFAASTSDAVEPIVPENESSLTISYRYGETAFSGVQVKLYKVATVSADFKYTLTSSFETTGLVLNGIKSTSEWNVVRSTLEAHILAYGITPSAVLTTDTDGKVHIDTLGTGIYLAIVDQIEQDNMYYYFESSLTALPGLSDDGHWQYQVSVNAKAEALPPIGPDEKEELKVLKLWKGDEGQTDRPKNVEVEIFRNGTSYKTVELSEENNWSYSWSADDDGSKWTVIEKNVPKGYAMTVEEKDSSFVITNTFSQSSPDDPIGPPTGDTSNMLVYILLMSASGCLMLIIGIAGKRKSS